MNPDPPAPLGYTELEQAAIDGLRELGVLVEEPLASREADS